MQKNNKTKRHIPYASRAELGVAVGIACLNIAALALLTAFTEIPPAVCAVITTLVFLAEIAALGAYIASRARIAPTESVHSLMSEEGSTVFRSTKKPVITFNSFGKVLWYNDAMCEILPTDTNFVGKDIADAVWYFAFNARNTTGAELVVDGGNTVQLYPIIPKEI